MGYSQRFIGRKGAPLSQRLSDCPKLDRVEVRFPYFHGMFSARGVDLIQVHEPKGGILAYLAHQFMGIPYVLTRRTFAPPKISWKNRQIYQEASAVVAVSAMISQILTERTLRAKTEICPDALSSLPVELEKVQEIRNRFPDRFLIGHAAAFVPNKGQLVLIEAMRSLAGTLPELHLVLLGKGPDEARLKEAAQGLCNVSFEGHVENLGDYFTALDLYIHPSLQEGLGSVILDAMHAGLPVIASRAGGIPEIVKDRQNGLLVEAGNPQAIADAILLLYEDEHLRGLIGKRAEKYTRDFTPEMMARNYEEIYRSIHLD